MGRYGKGKTHAHAAGVTLHRGVHEVSNLGKIHDVFVSFFYFSILEAQDATIQKNIFTPG